ncbi:T6SS immunity protein Tli4 family protein [Burkholderia sp. BCC0398]|uniref:T6SS immunity protein Tli4 family protein n=1 Tax=Burkholderia sp. BCC0398 TaxID=2676297 RepID=UPI001FC81A7F|nr:T6SS immunity protein Tli4 family protein [Burkholderia sp. BCC0398]
MSVLTRVRKVLLISATTILLGLTACAKNNPSEYVMTTPVMHDTRPWCIGRFALDLPSDIAVYNQQFKYMDYTIETTRNISRNTFLQQVDAREKELKTTLRMDMTQATGTTNNVWLKEAIRPNDDTRLFIFRKADTTSIDIPYKAEGYAWSSDTLFTLKTLIGARYDDSNLQVANQILRHIGPRQDWEIPVDGAFCFNGGAISGKPFRGFDATLSVGLLPGTPSTFVVKLRESVDVDQKASLLDGLPAFEIQLKSLLGRYKILRKGKRQFAGMEAEELLIAISEDGVQKYHFYLLAPGVEYDLSKPHTAIQLLFGAAPDSITSAAQATSPVNEAQAIQAWDAVLNSFHYRGPRPGEAEATK